MSFPQNFLQMNGDCESHLQFTFKEGLDAQKFLSALGNTLATNILGTDNPNGESPKFYGANTGTVLLGFRPEFWRSVSKGAGVPANMTSFTNNIVGINGAIAPADQQDLWIHVTQTNTSTLYDSVRKIIDILEPYCTLASEQITFTYHNSLTLDGFVDGVGNSNLFGVIPQAVIPDGQPGAGGTTLLVQKWLMNVAEMKALDVTAGENMYGRTKYKSIQLNPLPDNSHVARNQYHDKNGQKHDIVRRNTYFGNSQEAGAMFVGFATDIDTTMGMLKQMYGVGPDGIQKTDRLLDFCTAKSSAIYFVPSIDDLKATGVVPPKRGSD